MGGSLGVRFPGPLTPFVDGLAGELRNLGYTPSTVRVHLQLWAQLSRWLVGQGLEPAELTGAAIDRFLVERRRTHAVLYSAQALAPGLAFLRREGVVPATSEPVRAGTAVDAVMERFQSYLRVERGVLEATAETYAHRGRPFLENRVRDGVLDLASLTAGDVWA